MKRNALAAGVVDPAGPFIRLHHRARASRSDRRRRRRCWRRGTQQQGARGGRVGDRGDQGSADAVREDRRHRRPGPLSPSRSAARRSYTVFVRGYGLVDSPRVSATPGKALNLTAVIAPNEHAAAQYYPAGNWLSMMRIPEAGEFPGTGPQGNGINPEHQEPGGVDADDQVGRLHRVPSARHQGDARNSEGARHFPSLQHAWERRLASGQAGAQMLNGINNLGKERALLLFADWTDRINRGEVPPAPPRPQGVERNVVITMWDWADPKVVPARRGVDRSPQPDGEREWTALRRARAERRLRAGARSEDAHDQLGFRSASAIPTRRRPRRRWPAPSPYFGEEPIWTSKNNVHNPMLDEKGRLVADLRRALAGEPGVLQGRLESSVGKGVSDAAQRPPSGRCTTRPPRQLTHIATCFGTHHLMFAEDANNTLWTSGGGQVVGWLNRKMFDETGDEEKSQGWTALIMDTNGNGKARCVCRAGCSRSIRQRTSASARRSTPSLPRRTARSGARCSAIQGRSCGWCPDRIRRRPRSPKCMSRRSTTRCGPASRRAARDVDRNGVFWSALASGHLASFDRRKCKGPLNGPKATGQHCPEGWTLYTEPAAAVPRREGRRQRRRQLLHLGRSVRCARPWRQHADQYRQRLGRTAGVEGWQVGGDARAVSARLLYQVDGRTHRRSEGRMERARACGRRSARRTPFHMETGKGTTSKVYHVQLRPDPLAK